MPLDEEDGSGTLHDLGNVLEEDGSGTLYPVIVYEETSAGLIQVFDPEVPRDLSALYNFTTDEVDLSWTPTQRNSQDVYRCQGSGCDPFLGTKIADVSAGTDSYSDSTPQCDGGRTFVYGVEDPATGHQTTVQISEPLCPT